MIRGLLAVMVAALCCGAAKEGLGQPAPSAPSLCYEVVEPPVDIRSRPNPTILVDRCSGKTWELVNLANVDREGRPVGGFVVKWVPLPREP
jgi:hypothetical protein